MSRIWQRLSARGIWFREFGARIYDVPYLHGVLFCIGRTVRGFVRDDCHIMAAAVSFYAVLSLIPFMLLMVSIAGYVLEYLGQDYAGQEALFAHLSEYVRAIIPFTNEDFIQRLRGITLNREAYGVTGLIILFVTAGLVFRSLELAFARVFKTEHHRSLLVHQLLFIVFILAIGLLFLGVHYLSVVGSSVVSGHHEGFADAFEQALQRHSILGLVVAVLTGTLVFVVLLKYFSHQRVRLRASLFGGILFACLWMIASKLFGYYLQHLARFSLLYGSLASLAVVVVWIFYSSTILLLCTEFTCVLQNRFWPIGEVTCCGEPTGELAANDYSEQASGEGISPASESPPEP